MKSASFVTNGQRWTYWFTLQPSFALIRAHNGQRHQALLHSISFSLAFCFHLFIHRFPTWWSAFSFCWRAFCRRQRSDRSISCEPMERSSIFMRELLSIDTTQLSSRSALTVSLSAYKEPISAHSSPWIESLGAEEGPMVIKVHVAPSHKIFYRKA